jgi:hypothetical protein
MRNDEKRLLILDGFFVDTEAAIAHAESLAKELVWHPDLRPGSKLCVVDEEGTTVAEIDLRRPLHRYCNALVSTILALSI